MSGIQRPFVGTLRVVNPAFEDKVLQPNVFLHYVLDDWFAREVQPRLKGQAFLIRYADDAVIGFTDERDARRVLDVLPKRFGRYGLRLHPEKTRLVRFHRPPRRSDHKRPSSDRAPGTFELLGFTHYWVCPGKGTGW